MIDDFIRETTLAAGDLVRFRWKRVAMAAALALSSLAVIVVIGDAKELSAVSIAVTRACEI